MRNGCPHTVILGILTAAGAHGCAGQGGAAGTSDRTAVEPEIMYGLSASNESFGAELFFGEWVTQIVRIAPRGRQGPPWAFDSGVLLDSTTTELRPKLDLTLAEDGTYSLIANRSSVTADRTIVFGTWSISGGKVALTLEGEPTWVFTYRGGKLVTDKEDGTQMVLGRR